MKRKRDLVQWKYVGHGGTPDRISLVGLGVKIYLRKGDIVALEPNFCWVDKYGSDYLGHFNIRRYHPFSKPLKSKRRKRK